MFQSGASLCRILSVASDAPVCGTGFTPGQSSLGASAVLHSAPVAPILGVFLSYSLRCLRCSSPWHLVHPRTIQSGGLCRASFRPGCSIPGRPFNVFSLLPRMLQSVAPGSPRTIQSGGLGRAPLRPGCSNPGRLFDVFSPLPRTLRSVAPGSPPDDPVRGLMPCFIPPRLLQYGASFLSYPLRCLGCSSPWHRVLPQTIQSGGLGRAPLRPGSSNPGRLFIVFSPFPRMLQSVAPGSPPDDPVRGLEPCFIPPRLLQSGASFFRILSVASDAPVLAPGFFPDDPVRGLGPCSSPARMLQSGASFCRILSNASDAPVRGTGFTPGRSSPGASAVLHSAQVPPIRGVFLSYSLRCLGCSSPWHLVHPRMIQSWG